ncbi:MAG: RluA family pseudouridine synthase [Eubacteriales bacterium]|nr:RluA family pseudouridine synthase [Eubacteriales bacterium]
MDQEAIKETLMVDDDGVRLDLFLSDYYENMSRTYLQKLIKEECIHVNGTIKKKNYILQNGDKIEINLPKPQLLKVEPEDIDIEIVYEDEHLAVVNKPRGMVVHPAPGNYSGTMVNALLNRLDTLSNINGVIRPGIVHRLDKDTTGLLVVAKNNMAHQSLSTQIKEYKAERFYMALVHGHVKDNQGVIDLPIGRDEKDRKKMAVTEKNAKRAITNYVVINHYPKYTLLKLQLETGRTHQIRVHMSYLGYPIVGDMLYGRKENQFNFHGQLLHAKRLTFIHPFKKVKMDFDSDLPADFQKILKILEDE